MGFKNTIIFGASGDIGSCFASKLCEESDSLTLVVRKKTRLSKKLANLSHVKVIEFSYPENLEAIKKEITKNSRNYDLIINTIGYYKTTNNNFDKEDFDSLIINNFNVLQFILEILKTKVSAQTKFINISSIASYLGSDKEIAYSSSKLLADNLLSSLREDKNYSKVRTLNVRPGAVISKMTQKRKNASSFIDPNEMVELCLNIINSGTSLSIPVIDIFRGKS